ncbi:MAG: hypothetical protein QXF56_03390 [Candidatus Micrarchaeia archaeon]
MDRTAILSVLGIILVLVTLANTPYLERLRSEWAVDTTASFFNRGEKSIRTVILPSETKFFEYEGKNIIALENTAEEMLLADERFEDALASQDRLVLYVGRETSAVLASSYFNEAEVAMLSKDSRIVGLLKNAKLLGVTNISYIDAWDPTNARVELVWVDEEPVRLLVPSSMSSENFSDARSSAEFSRVIGNSRKLTNKTLLLYHPSKSSMNIVIPVNFNEEEVVRLAKNSAVKTALEYMEVEAGRILKLDETREFQNVDIAELPYHPNTKIFVSFSIISGIDFLSEEFLVYLAIFVVLLVILYVLYTILIA